MDGFQLTMRKLFALILLLLASPSFAGGGATMMVVGGTAAGAGVAECPGDLICQNFEGTGYDNVSGLGGVWTEAIGTGGVVDEDDATATVLRGSQQLKLYAGDSGQTSNDAVSFASTTEVYFHYRWKTPDATPTNSHNMLNIYNGGTIRPYLLWITNGTYRCYNGTAYGTGATTLQNDTAYHIWGHYKGEASEGANDGIMQVYISATTSKPGTADCQTTAGTDVDAVDKIRFNGQYQTTQFIDQVIISTTVIGDVAE